jgi:hypothetical protein
MRVYRAFAMFIRRRRRITSFAPTTDGLLLEDGVSFLLMENGDTILLES